MPTLLMNCVTMCNIVQLDEEMPALLMNCVTMCNVVQLDDEMPTLLMNCVAMCNIVQLDDEMPTLLMNCVTMCNIVQLDEEMPALLMNWVPRKLAPQIRCVFTMIDGTPQHKALMEREPQPFTLQLTPLNDEDRQVCSATDRCVCVVLGV